MRKLGPRENASNVRNQAGGYKTSCRPVGSTGFATDLIISRSVGREGVNRGPILAQTMVCLIGSA